VCIHEVGIVVSPDESEIKRWNLLRELREHRKGVDCIAAPIFGERE